MQKGCPKCGRMVDSNETSCPYCHYNFNEINNFFKKVDEEKYLEDEKYAGFVKRLVAGMFDNMILSILFSLTIFAFYKQVINITLKNPYIVSISFSIISFIVTIFYHAIFERTSWHGSIGKRIIGIEVVDQYENPETFGLAFKRNLAKILNSLTLGIGFLICATPPTKQALNDRITHTFVINKLVMKEDDKLTYANQFKRLVAYILDLLLIATLVYALFEASFTLMKNADIQKINMIKSVRNILSLVIIFFYFPFAESRNGKTFGKAVMHLRVVKSNEKTVGFITAFVRQFLVIIDIESCAFLLPFVTKKRQTIKDILTNTVVIRG